MPQSFRQSRLASLHSAGLGQVRPIRNRREGPTKMASYIRYTPLSLASGHESLNGHRNASSCFRPTQRPCWLQPFQGQVRARHERPFLQADRRRQSYGPRNQGITKQRNRTSVGKRSAVAFNAAAGAISEPMHTLLPLGSGIKVRRFTLL